MFNAITWANPFRGVDVHRRDPAAHGNFLEMGGVGGVVTTNHHHQIERFIHQGEHGVLAFLGGIADGVEGKEMLVEHLRAIAAQQRALK